MTYHRFGTTAARDARPRLQGLLPSALLLGLSGSLLLSGCAVGHDGFAPNAGGAPTGGGAGASKSGRLTGHVKGGNPPVTNSTVTLYAAATTGYSDASTQVATTNSDSSGNFNFSSFNCSANDQLYVVATGGNPGLGNGGSNPNLAMMAALGSCSAVQAGTPAFVDINEVTTIASVYALSGFMADATHVGTSSTNITGLKNAFATVSNLVDIPSGAALSITPAYQSNAVPYFHNSQVPQARINALANALAACVNSAGGHAGDSTVCGQLFTATTVNSVVPADTLAATLSIAQHPGNNASQIAGLITANPFFQPSLTTTQTSALTDWALALVFQGGGLGSSSGYYPLATGLAIDGEGNVWMPVATTGQFNNNAPYSDPGGLVAVFNNQGVPLSPSGTSSSSLGGYTAAGIHNPQSIAIDQNGFAWIGNFPTVTGGYGLGSITVLDKTGAPQYGTDIAPYTNPVMLSPNPYGIAVDANNNVWISSNTGTLGTPCGADNGSGPYGGSILGLYGSGNTINVDLVTDTYPDNSSCPTYLAVDPTGNLWTWDYGNYQVDDPYAISLTLFSTNDGSAVGGPDNNYYPLNSAPNTNMAIDSSGSGWFVANLSVGGPVTSGIGKMPAIDGITDQSVLVPEGPGGGVPSIYNPTVFQPRTGVPRTAIAIDGAGQAWYANGQTGGSYSSATYGLFAVNNADSQLLSPANGYIGADLGGFLALDFNQNLAALGVDSSGNVWVAGQAYSPSGSGGSQLTEFVGIAAPAPTPLVSALVSGAPGTRP